MSRPGTSVRKELDGSGLSVGKWARAGLSGRRGTELGRRKGRAVLGTGGKRTRVERAVDRVGRRG